MGPLIPSKIQL